MSIALSVAILNCAASAQASEQLSKVDQDKISQGATHLRWLRLLQYESVPFQGYESLIDNPEFFFAVDGKNSPEHELSETILAMLNGKLHHAVIEQTASCAFPARRKFIVETLGIKLPDVNCPDFFEWRDALHADSITLVFSTAYANNPASMFGHTFLKLNQSAAKSDKSAALFDYGVSFAAAVPPTESKGILYAWKALFGGYPGVFSVAPYYMKITEYAAMESRDLWEYELNINAEETSWLIANLWELFSAARIDYYFAKENCAYELLALLEAAKLDWDLTAKANLIALPAETVRLLATVPNAIKDVHFRPAARRLYQAEISRLTGAEKTIFYGILDEKIAASECENPRVLDAVSGYLTYIEQTPAIGLKQNQKTLLRNTLVARAKLGQQDPSKETPLPQATNRPDIGHKPRRAGVFARRRSKQATRVGVLVGGGYHGLSEKSDGYEDHLQIHYLEAEGEYDSTAKKSYVSRFLFADILSLNTYEPLDPRFSWSLHVGYETLTRCLYCRELQIAGSGGLTFDFLSGALSLYTMVQVFTDVDPTSPQSIRSGPGLNVGAVARLSSYQTVTSNIESTTDVVNGVKSTCTDYLGRFLYTIHGATNMDLYLGSEAGTACSFQEKKLVDVFAGTKIFF